MPGGNSDVVPPESIPNSEVKHVSVDGSVGSPHVRVEHRQAPILRKKAIHLGSLFLYAAFSETSSLLIPVALIN